MVLTRRSTTLINLPQQRKLQKQRCPNHNKPATNPNKAAAPDAVLSPKNRGRPRNKDPMDTNIMYNSSDGGGGGQYPKEGMAKIISRHNCGPAEALYNDAKIGLYNLSGGLQDWGSEKKQNP